jgi:hypothetical protein
MPERDPNCKYIEKCPMYQYLKFDLAKKMVIQKYCKGDYETCSRRMLRESGKEVPEKLLPNGTMMK